MGAVERIHHLSAAIERIELQLPGVGHSSAKKLDARRRGPMVCSELDRARARKALKEAGYVTTRSPR
jgi:hypothetical protein